MKSRTLVTSCRHLKAPTIPDGRPTTTPRYAAALAAVADAWEPRPMVFTPERELFEMGELKAARAEVRAAWIEAAALFGITPDQAYPNTTSASCDFHAKTISVEFRKSTTPKGS